MVHSIHAKFIWLFFGSKRWKSMMCWIDVMVVHMSPRRISIAKFWCKLEPIAFSISCAQFSREIHMIVGVLCFEVRNMLACSFCCIPVIAPYADTVSCHTSIFCHAGLAKMRSNHDTWGDTRAYPHGNNWLCGQRHITWNTQIWMNK